MFTCSIFKFLLDFLTDKNKYVKPIRATEKVQLDFMCCPWVGHLCFKNKGLKCKIFLCFEQIN